MVIPIKVNTIWVFYIELLGTFALAFLLGGWCMLQIPSQPISNDRGTDGIGNGEFGWDVGLMNHWVHTRLFWDPTQDVDSLYRYYIRRTYREAAPQMLAYYELIKNSWLDPKNSLIVATIGLMEIRS